MFNTAKDVIKKLKDEQDKETNNIWAGSKFEFISDLKIDYSGKVGEITIYEFLKENTDWEIIFNGDSNTNPEDGTYDIKINGLRGEIKTARLGKSSTKNKFGGNFQHENLKNSDECDYIILLDFEPNQYHITILDSKIDLKKPIEQFNNITPHNRPGTNNFKLDLKRSTSIEESKKRGFSLVDIKEDTDCKEIIEFFGKFFIKK